MSKEKRKGTSFETQVVEYLREKTGGDIDRMPLHGTKDRGDVSGFRIRGQRVVLECKNRQRLELSQWLDEAEEERGNDDAEYAFVVFKRKGKGEARMGETYVLCTLENLAALANGSREV